MKIDIKNSLSYHGIVNIQRIKNNRCLDQIQLHNHGTTELSRYFANALIGKQLKVPVFANIVNSEGTSLLKKNVYIQSKNPCFEDDLNLFSAEIRFTVTSYDVLSVNFNDIAIFQLYGEDNTLLASINSNVQLRDLIQSGTSLLVNWHLYIQNNIANNTSLNSYVMSYIFMNMLLGNDIKQYKPYNLDICINSSGNMKSIVNETILLTGFYVYKDSLENYYLQFNSLLTDKDIDKKYLNNKNNIYIYIKNICTDSEYRDMLVIPLEKNINDLFYSSGSLSDIVIRWEIGIDQNVIPMSKN